MKEKRHERFLDTIGTLCLVALTIVLCDIGHEYATMLRYDHPHQPTFAEVLSKEFAARKAERDSVRLANMVSYEDYMEE